MRVRWFLLCPWLLLLLWVGASPRDVGAEATQVEPAEPGIRYMSMATGGWDAFDLSADAEWMVTSSESGTAVVWNQGRAKHSLPGHQAAVTRDGRWVVTGTAFFLSGEGDLRIYEAKTGRLHRQIDSGAVRVLAIADGDGHEPLILMGGHGGEVKVWSLPDGELVHDWRTPDQWMTSVGLSRDGRLVAASSAKRCYVWDRSSGKRMDLGGHSEWAAEGGRSSWVDRALLGPDGSLLLTTTFAGIGLIHELEHGKTLAILKHGERIEGAAFSPDGRFVATGSNDGTGRVWTVPEGELAHEFEVGREQISDAAFSPDGRYVAFGAHFEPAALYRLPEGELAGRHRGGVLSSRVAFTDDGSQLAVGGKGRVKLIDLATGQDRRKYGHRPAPVRTLEFSPDGRRLLAEVAGFGTTVWNLAGAAPPIVLQRDVAGWVGSDRFWVGTASSRAGETKDPFELWSAVSGSRLAELGSDPLSVVANAASDGSLLATASQAGSVSVWNGTTGALVTTLRASRTRPRSIAVTSGGRYVAVGDDAGGVTIWKDLAPDPWQTRRQERTERVDHLEFSHDERFLVSGSSTAQRLYAWDLDKDAQLHRLPMNSQIATFGLSGGGRLLTTLSSSYRSEVWDIAERRNRIFTAHRDKTTTVASTPGSKWFVTGSADRSVRLFDEETLRQFGEFEGLRSAATAVALDPAERFVAAGDDTGGVALWDRLSGEEVARLFTLLDSEWVVVTPDGSWDASDRRGYIQAMVAWVDDEPVQLVKAMEWHRGDLLRDALAPWGAGAAPRQADAAPVEIPLPPPTSSADAAPAEPSLVFHRVAHFGTAGQSGELAAHDGIIYVAAQRAGLEQIDLRAERPAFRKVSNRPVRSLHWDGGDRLYATDGDLLIFDVADPAAPRLLWVVEAKKHAQNVTVQGDHVFVAASFSGMVVYDVSDIRNPIGLAAFDTKSSHGTANDVVVEGDLAYVGEGGVNIPSGFEVISVKKKKRPRWQHTEPTRHPVRALTKDGDHLYLATGDGGLEIFDVQKPKKPVRVSHFDTGHLWAVQVEDGRAYLATTPSLMVVDVSDPGHPTLLGEYVSENGNLVRDAKPLPGGLVLLSLGAGGVEIVRVSTKPGSGR